MYGPICIADSPLTGLLCDVSNILNKVIPVLILLGVVFFIWGVVRYVIADGEEAKQKGRDQIIYGLIGFAVIAGLWGLVRILVITFDLRVYAPTLDTVIISSTSSCTIGTDSTKLQDVLCYVTKIINDSVIPLLFALATAFFVWGAVKFFILDAGEEAKREQGRQFMIWGIIALAVMLSVWGLVSLLTSTFLGNPGSVLPQVCPPGGCP